MIHRNRFAVLHCEAVSCYAEIMENDETVETVYIVRGINSNGSDGAIYGVYRDQEVACEVAAQRNYFGSMVYAVQRYKVY